MTSDANALLHRLQTTAAVCCAALAIVALVVADGEPRPAVGVSVADCSRASACWGFAAASEDC